MGNRSYQRRYHRRLSRSAFLLAAYPRTLPLLLYPRRFGLYGSYSVHPRQNVQKVRAFGQSLYAYDYGLRLLGPGNDQHENACGRKGKNGDSPRYTFLFLRSQAPDTYRRCGRVSSRHLAQCGPYHLLDVSTRYRNGNRNGTAHEKHFLERRNSSVHHGASRLPPPAVQEPYGSPLG